MWKKKTRGKWKEEDEEDEGEGKGGLQIWAAEYPQRLDGWCDGTC